MIQRIISKVKVISPSNSLVHKCPLEAVCFSGEDNFSLSLCVLHCRAGLPNFSVADICAGDHCCGVPLAMKCGTSVVAGGLAGCVTDFQCPHDKMTDRSSLRGRRSTCFGVTFQKAQSILTDVAQSWWLIMWCD